MPEATTEAPEHRQCRQRTDAEETAIWWANLRRLPAAREVQWVREDGLPEWERDLLRRQMDAEAT